MQANPVQHLLDDQLDFLRRQADLQRFEPKHADIEDLIALALETLERIKWRRRTLRDELVLAYLRRWHEIALRSLKSLEQIEGDGFRLERSAQFRFAINEASMAADSDRIAAAQQRLEAGRGSSLDEILDAIPPEA